MYKFYTGIGSRNTPNDVCNSMTKLAQILYQYGYILRSGHADGADKAFESGAFEKKEIYIPWKSFDNSTSDMYIIPDEAFEIAGQIHPAWDRCSDAVKKLHARNILQVLGQDLKTPSDFLLCWTHNAKIVGGTATAINLAKKHNVPVFNLADNYVYKKTVKYIKRSFK